MVSEPTDFSFQDHIIPVALAQWDESKEAEYNCNSLLHLVRDAINLSR